MTSWKAVICTSVVLIMLAWLKSVSDTFGNEVLFITTVLGGFALIFGSMKLLWSYYRNKVY